MHTKETKRPKTGGRQKGSGGKRVFLTIPKETAARMPSNARELKMSALLAILEKYIDPISEATNAGFVPSPADVRYMNDDEDISFPPR